MNQRLRPATHHSMRMSAFGAPLVPDDRPVPTPSGTQVLLRVHACGVCHSDLHLSDGYFDLGGGRRLDMARGMPLPMTLGHEVAGEVFALGEGAEGVAVGGRYVLYPWVGCGQCALCALGEEHLCGTPRHHGVNVDGGFSNFVLVPHPRYLLPIAKLDPAYAAALACSGLTAYSALRKAGPADAGRPLLIIGAGGVGTAALAVARALGHAPVVADIDPAKRSAALQAGAAQVLDPNDPQARKHLLKQYGGVAAAIDFVGASASADFGLACLRKGGRLVVVGLFGGALELALPLLPMRSIAIEGSYVGSLQEMRELMALAHAGKLAAMPLQRSALDAVQAALDALRAGRILGRAVVAPERPTVDGQA